MKSFLVLLKFIDLSFSPVKIVCVTRASDILVISSSLCKINGLP